MALNCRISSEVQNCKTQSKILETYLQQHSKETSQAIMLQVHREIHILAIHTHRQTEREREIPVCDSIDFTRSLSIPFNVRIIKCQPKWMRYMRWSRHVWIWSRSDGKASHIFPALPLEESLWSSRPRSSPLSSTPSQKVIKMVKGWASLRVMHMQRQNEKGWIQKQQQIDRTIGV